MTEKPRIYVTFEPEVYSQVAAYGEKRRIISKSEAAHDLIRMGLEAYTASNAPAPRPQPAPEESAPTEMERLFQSLTAEQARLLLKVMERMLEPVRAKSAE